MRRKRGRRWAMVELGPAYLYGGKPEDGTIVWHWIAWHLFERVSGVATEDHAREAIDHFLESEHTWTLAPRAPTV